MLDLRWYAGAIHVVTFKCLLPTRMLPLLPVAQFANQELQYLDALTYRRLQYVYVGILAEFRA